MKRMKTRILAIAVLAAVAALFAFPMAANAETLPGKSWQVTFNDQDKMVETYPNGDLVDGSRVIADSLAGMEPGDSITLTISLKQDNADSADWYMSNEVLDSLEAQFASGSAYGYYLTFTSPNKDRTRVLYDSSRVGGDNTDGLYDATNNLEDFFYLDTLSKGQEAKVELTVSLDGETEGNAYFNKDAELKMRFAVEKVTTSNTPPTKSNRNVVVTGDTTNLMPFYIAMGVSGVLMLVLAIASLRSRKRDQEQGGGAR